MNCISYSCVLRSVCFAALFLTENAFPQDVNDVTAVRMYYWRANHPSLEIRIERTIEGKLYLNSYIYDRVSEKRTAVSSKYIEETDLKLAKQFCNDVSLRRFFLETPRELELDGSSVELKVSQNQFAVMFVSQYCFEPDAPEAQQKLRQVLLGLMDLADFKVPTDELY